MTKEEVDSWLGILSCRCKIWPKETDGRIWNDGYLEYDCDINGMKITRGANNLRRGGNSSKIVSIIDYTEAKTLRIDPEPD